MRSQRLRVTFSKGRELRFITHLDLMRFWERAMRRAGVNVAYSEGFSPHPQFSLAAPLPVGVSGSAELMDVFLAEPTTPEAFLTAVAAQLPPGLTVQSACEVALQLPSLQSLMRAADYRAELPTDVDIAELQERIDASMASDSIPWRHVREKEVREYDLRPLIQSIALDTTAAVAALTMRLQADNAATGRPDQVLLALGLPLSLSIERSGVVVGHAEPRGASRADGVGERESAG